MKGQSRRNPARLGLRKLVATHLLIFVDTESGIT